MTSQGAIKTRSGLAMAALGFTLLQAPHAFATSKSISYPPQAAWIGGASQYQQDGIALQPTGPAEIGINVVLPLDYEADTPLDITLYLRTLGPSCIADVIPLLVERARPGKPMAFGQSGLKTGAAAVSFPSNNAVVKKAFAIRPGTELRHQLPGDKLSLTVERDKNDPSDTCGQVWVQAIAIQYTVQPPP